MTWISPITNITRYLHPIPESNSPVPAKWIPRVPQYTYAQRSGVQMFQDPKGERSMSPQCQQPARKQHTLSPTAKGWVVSGGMYVADAHRL